MGFDFFFSHSLSYFTEEKMSEMHLRPICYNKVPDNPGLKLDRALAKGLDFVLGTERGLSLPDLTERKGM